MERLENKSLSLKWQVVMWDLDLMTQDIILIPAPHFSSSLGWFYLYIL